MGVPSEFLLLGLATYGYDIGVRQQKCWIHYLRDLYRTKNKHEDSKEFDMLFKRLHAICDKVIKIHDSSPKTKYPLCSQNVLARIQKSIDDLADAEYEDEECNRIAKRLRRERHFLTVCLEYPIDYHNNISERALRPMALLRKITYGNRSEKGMKTLETIMTIHQTCLLRGINPFEFFNSYLNGEAADIPIHPAVQKKTELPEMPPIPTEPLPAAVTPRRKK